MKKLLLSCLMTFVALSMSAQSFEDATWQAPLQGDNGTITMTLGFDKSSHGVNMIIDANESDEDLGTFYFRITMGGTYSVEGNKLSLNLDKESAKIEVVDIKFNDDMAAAVALMPDLKQQITDALKEPLEQSKAEVVSEFSLPETMTIDRVTADTLVLEGKEFHKI